MPAASERPHGHTLVLFDVDGTNNLSEQEWLDGNEALELSTSKSEFQRLRRATPGNDESTSSEELNFAKTMGIYGSRKPVEGYLEDVLRRLMKAIISLTGRVKGIQEVLDRTVLLEEITRRCGPARHATPRHAARAHHPLLSPPSPAALLGAPLAHSPVSVRFILMAPLLSTAFP